MIVLNNEFTQVRSQSLLHPSRHTTFHYIASRAKPKGRHISRLFGCFCLSSRAGSTQSSSTNLPGSCRGNRPGQAFLIRFHPTHPHIVRVSLSASRVASAPGRRSSKGRKHGFTSAIRSASKRRLGREDGGIRRGSFEKGVGEDRGMGRGWEKGTRIFMHRAHRDGR